MYQTVLDRGQWADVFDGLREGYTQTIAGGATVTAGTHKNLGGIVAIEDFQELVIFHSEHPAIAELHS